MERNCQEQQNSKQGVEERKLITTFVKTLTRRLQGIGGKDTTFDIRMKKQGTAEESTMLQFGWCPRNLTRIRNREHLSDTG